MKKMLSLFAVCLLVVTFTAMAVVPAAATSNYDAIIAALKENVPSKDLEEYLPTAENILQQLDITDEQAEAVITYVKEAKAAVAEDAESVRDLPRNEKEIVVKKFNQACEALKVRYEVKPVEDPKQGNASVAIIYKQETGEKLAEVDTTPVNKTNVTTSVSVEVIVLAVVLMAGAVVAAIYGKKAVSAR